MKLTEMNNHRRLPYLPTALAIIRYRAGTQNRLPWPETTVEMYPYLNHLMLTWLGTTLPRWRRP